MQIQDDVEDYNEDGAWFRDPNYSMEEWSSVVSLKGLSIGYIEWVARQYEEKEVPVPQAVLDEMIGIHFGLSEDGTAPVSDKWRVRYPHEDWMHEVESFDTRIGYEAWLLRFVEEDPEWQREQEAEANASALDETTPPAPKAARLRF